MLRRGPNFLLEIVKLSVFNAHRIGAGASGVLSHFQLALQRHFVRRGASMNHRCRPGPPTRRRLGAAGLQNVAVVLGTNNRLCQNGKSASLRTVKGVFVKRTNRLADKVEWVFCTVLLGALTGCTGYVDHPRSREVYIQPPPAYVSPPVAYVQPPPVYEQPPAVQVEASVGVSIRTEDDFYEPLSPYGRWEVVGSYGRCWIPGRVEANWRPYSNGYWQRTDAGWYWASDEPWAWATYHYGRWDLSAQFGWY